MKPYSLKQKAGVVLLDLPRLLWALRGRGSHWTRYGNRQDHLRVGPEGNSVACDWEFTRTLHACDVFPWTGRRLLAAALREWPIRHASAPAVSTDEEPEVSFIIGHRGMDRLASLRRVLESIAAQEGVRCESIVVEQDLAPAIRDSLPGWVTYVHAPVPSPQTPYSRSRAFNAGAEKARGRVLVLHDNDLLVPAGYAREAARLAAAGYEVINPKRFIFYLSEAATAPDGRLDAHAPLVVLENATGGGSLALARETFEALGRMDESFEGWGGEDVEFWQRALTRRVWNSGYLPLVHLGHPAQPGKTPEKNTPGMARLKQLSAIPPEQRIAALRRQQGGAA